MTRVLVLIKNLLDVLSQWAVLRATEQQVSNVYVHLGDALCETTGVLATYGIDMSYVNFLECVAVTC
jgi:hypothetical protein